MKKKWMRLLTTLLLTMLWQSVAVAQTKIAVITDTHVMAPDLLVNDGTAWQNKLASDRKLLDYSQTVFDYLVEKFKSGADKPDLLLLTGDLTKDGELLSHQYVADKLKVLKDAGVKVYVIPGNHDIDNSNAESYDGATTKKVSSITSEGFASLYADYGYSNTTRDPNSLSYAAEPVEGLVLIGIDSHTGALPSGTLDWVCKQAQKAYNEGKQVIAMMHHPLFPHILGADMYVSSATVADYATVRNSLADAGVRVVLSGHFHTSDIAKDWNADLTKEIYDVNTGSTISYPCDYRVMMLSADMQTLDIKTGSVTSLPEDDSFSEKAKERLKASMTKIAKAKIEQKIGTSPLIATIVNGFADLTAQIFIVHAEGDEPEYESKVDEIRKNDYFGLFATFGYGNNIESVLQDKSNYGVEGRENRTADRSLNIPMPDLTESLTLAADGWSTYCSDRRLDLTKTEGIKGYVVESITTDAVQLKEVSIVPAETGFIVNGTEGATVKFNATDKDPDDVSGNLLKGVLEATQAPADAYVLSTQSGTGFYPVSTDVTLPAHKAYLAIPSGGSVRKIVMLSDSQTAAISEQRTSKAGAAFYTLQGVRVAKVSRGVYVKNGKLIIIK